MSTPTQTSLSGRLLRRLIAIQVATVVIGMLAWMSFSPYVGYDDLAAESAQRYVVGSLRTDRTGDVRLEPSPDLLAYAARRPGFAFGVYADGRVLPNSTPALAEVMTALGSNVPVSGKIEVQGKASNAANFATLHHFGRPVTVVTSGNDLQAEDASAFLSIYLPQLLAMFGPALLGAAVVVPLMLRASFHPLRRAAERAAGIDVRSLGDRLPDEGLSSELAPFVEAINALLDRLQDGVSRQHLFTANAAHELRTPAAILAARIDALHDGDAKRELKRDVRRLTVLLDQLLSVARLEQSEIDASEDVDLLACARDVVADCAPLALRGGRHVDFEADVRTAELRGSARAISSALANLVENALRVEPPGGSVIVRLIGQDDGRRVRLEVVDHGPGVCLADRKRVFEPFWRREDKKPGTGLGLAIVAEAVRLHDGRVWIEETPGGGATFVVELPATSTRARARQPRAMSAG